MKKTMAFILWLVAVFAFGMVGVAETDGWRGAYASAIQEHGNPYGNIYVLADLDIDGTPELILGTYPGTGMASCVEKLFTYQNGQCIALPTTNTYISLQYELYQQNSTNALRIEGGYDYKEGWAYLQSSFGEYALNNGLQFREVFTAVTETKDVTFEESISYYIYQSLTTEQAYQNEKNLYYADWHKVDTYASVFLRKNKRPSSDDVAAFIASYAEGPALAQPGAHRVVCNGTPVSPVGYNIAGNNYYKLRDIAAVLKNTNAKFEVVWDEATQSIHMTTAKDYTLVGGELAGAASGAYPVLATPCASSLYINGNVATLRAYTINGNNYFKLRDLGSLLGFGVGFNEATATVEITG